MTGGMCLEQTVDLKRGSKSAMENALRRLLLSEARVVIVLLGEKNWIELMKALRTELVIAGRFIFFSPQESRWSSSKKFLEQWPQFDQLLLTVTPEKTSGPSELLQLATRFANLPFPQHWLKQFWATAFQCHIDGEVTPGQQFSKECSHKQILNVTTIAPDVDIAPISIADEIEKIYLIIPGALIQRISDCLNEPQEALFSTIHSLHFSHPFSHELVSFNETTLYRDHTLIVNRVLFDAQLEYEPIAKWNHHLGFKYTAVSELVMEERDGSRVPLTSTCPRSACSAELSRRRQAGDSPKFKDSLKSVAVLVYAVCAVLAFFVCLMCMYQRVVCRTSDNYRICTSYTFGGLAMLCLVSITFFMTPNPIGCFSRRILFPVAVTAIFAPITVKSICIWRADLLAARGEVGQAAGSHSVFTFWICAGIVLVQIVISCEWAVFESAAEMTYVASIRHGNSWRCAPGSDFEHRVLWSCALSGVMIIVSLIYSTLTVRHIQSRQNILISVLAVIFATALYIALPLLSFRLRDIICATMQLTLCFIVTVVSYCQRAFTSDDSESSNISLVPSSIRQSQQIQPYWVETTTTRSISQKQALFDDYHHASTFVRRPEKIDIRLNSNAKYGQSEYGSSATSNNLVSAGRPNSQQIKDNEKYCLPPSSNAKYGQQKYAVDNESEEEQNARL
ncbi:hypothetical protein RB195_011677 [Necator americanus]|uniref:G-protein coupled receptors family 3 profile domain-containing protein n=1 Tax=Necator americanus TaxID=51031 RepID=A0ABR1D3I6_NECAM